MLKLLLVLIQDSEGKGSCVELAGMGVGIWMSWSYLTVQLRMECRTVGVGNEEHEMMFGLKVNDGSGE
ncbi:hypothetical protein C5167_049699, partial [Papaver somniferum]